MKIDILSLFPEMIQAMLTESMLKRADQNKLINFGFHQYRDYVSNKHRKVDDKPYGGGVGLLMRVEPVKNAMAALKQKNSHVIYFSPKGQKLDMKLVTELAKKEHLIMLCGHYEGFDQRIIDAYVDEEISIGDYVLTGGELPACVTIDAISRHIEGVLGKSASLDEESFNDNLLEYPHYTMPQNVDGMEVPEILLSGHHAKIEEWRYQEAIKITYLRRKDLLLEHILHVLQSDDKQRMKKLIAAVKVMNLSEYNIIRD